MQSGIILLPAAAALLALLTLMVFVRRGEGAAARRARALTLSIRHRLGRLEGYGPVKWLAAAKCELEFRAWRLLSGERSFAAFYARQVARKLDRGGAHVTLGRRVCRPGARIPAGDDHDSETFADTGLEPFRRLLAAGLAPEEVVVDFGCGSLRVGQHLMRFLAPGNYWGLDVTDRFYRDGIAMVGPEEVARCKPNLRLIGAAGLAETQAARPSLVFSIAVLSHVPAAERPRYFDRLLSLVSEDTRLLLQFKASARPSRIAGKSWSMRAEEVIGEIARRRPGARFTITRLDGREAEVAARSAKVLLTVRWQDAPGHAGARVAPVAPPAAPLAAPPAHSEVLEDTAA